MQMVDKILFFLTNDYTHYCLAHALQKKMNFEMYAISEVTKRPQKFFQNQKLVNFEKMWFFHEQIKKEFRKNDLEYLAQFEKKYKINLWKLVQNERIFLYFKNFHVFSYEEILSILEQECRFFESVLEEIKPDFLFTRLPSLHHQELIYQMCKNSGIKVVAMNYTMLGGKTMIAQEQKKLDHMEDLENIECKNRNFEELQNYIKSFDLVKQIEDKLLKPASGNLEKLKSGKDFLLRFETSNTHTHYTYYGRTKLKVFWYYLKEHFETKKRKSFIDQNLKNDLKFSEPFVYFPIHIEMERSLLLGAPYYVNQIEVIKSVAKSIPINFKLYVKEHPGQVSRGWRSKQEYKEITDIPNVVLIHPNFPKEKLYRKCSLVFSIAGTAGFEAACYGKSTITLVDLNYSVLPSVNTLRNFEELPKLIEKSLSQKVNPFDVDRYITLLEKNISEFDWSDFSKKLTDEFFLGTTQDAEISEEKMRLFLEKNSESLEIFANDHMKKIKWFNEREH